MLKFANRPLKKKKKKNTIKKIRLERRRYSLTLASGMTKALECPRTAESPGGRGLIFLTSTRFLDPDVNSDKTSLISPVKKM